MRNTRRILAVVISVCMIINMMAFSVYAKGTGNAASAAEISSAANSSQAFSIPGTSISGDAVGIESKASTYASTTSAASPPSAPSGGTVSGCPFVYGTGGSNCFRIPALVTLSDGTLIAAADARWNTTYDGGCGDTIVARSTNDGSTWTYSFANYLGDNGNTYNGSSSSCFIDPALAVTADDTIYMLVDLYPYGVALNGSGNTAPSTSVGFNSDGTLKLAASGSSSYSYYLKSGKIYSSSGTAVSGYTVDGYFNVYQNGSYVSNLFFSDSPYKVVRTGYLYLTKSTDQGLTWSEPLLLSNLKTSSEQVCLVGPGRGTVLSDGTILFPIYSYNSGSQQCGFIYSSDGVNWVRSNSGITNWSSEAAIVELSSTKLRVFYRNGNSRICYADVTKSGSSYTWGSPVTTSVSCNSNTQVSAIKVSCGSEDYILVSNPGNPSNQSGASYRTNGQIVTFKASDMSLVKTTSVPSVHSTNSFMYSCLTQLSSGNVAILYEDQENGWGAGSSCYYQMSFRTYALSDLGITYVDPCVANGHDYTSVETDGDVTYTCSRCGDTYTVQLPRTSVTVHVGETTEAIALTGNGQITGTGDSSIAAAAISVTQEGSVPVSYSASASTSLGAYSTYSASNLIDGNASTYYWSNSSQTVGAYAMVDLGALVRFDAVQISSVAHGDYCSSANVQVSADGSSWTTIGTHTGSSSTAVSDVYTVPDSVTAFRYIRVVLTQARSYWWKLAEIAWGSYDGSTFTRAATSGTVGSGTEEKKSLTFTGVSVGTTSYTVDGTRYDITVEAPLHTHSYSAAVTIAPSCETDGEQTYTCSGCGDTYTETIPATGHSYSAEVTAPTCTADGYTTYTCEACGDSYQTDAAEAYGHLEQLTSDTATCTDAGLKTYTCSRCGNTRTEASPALGHSFIVTSTDASCSEPGMTVYTCERCSYSYSEETDAIPHNYTAVVTPATCTERGYTTNTCADCGASYVSDETAALGHAYTAEVTAAACTTQGYTTYTCSRCGDTYVDDIVEATGHSYGEVVTAPTCTEQGYTTHTCSHCGDTYVNAATAATGHSYTEAVTAPTCTAQGYTTYTCSACGDSYTDSRTEATGHTYNEAVTAPTCTAQGYTTYTCSTCGNSYTDNRTEATGHSYTYNTVEATCTTGGYTAYTCTLCGDSGRMLETAALDHDYVCTEDGTDLVYTCSRCSDSYRVAAMPTESVALAAGETYTITCSASAPEQYPDSSVASVTVTAAGGSLTAVDTLVNGRYVLTNSSYRLTTTASTYYSSWDSVGNVNGLAVGTFSTTGTYDSDLFTITAVSGGYTIQAPDGRYLTITESTKSTNLTLSTTPQVLTITDLGTSFAISSGSTYLDRYSTGFAASYPGSINENEQWTLYLVEDAGYQYTVTGVGTGETVMIADGTRYEISVHAHSYTVANTTAASCTAAGSKTWTCSCGDSYTETIAAQGHSYSAAEGTSEIVYTCSRCGYSYSEPIATTSYDQVSSIASGNTYVLTAYVSGKYYAVTHNGTTLSTQEVAVSGGKITSEVTDSMLWNYNGKFYYTSGTTTYYLYRSSYGWGSYKPVISTSGTSANYSSTRLGLGNYYLKYSSGNLTLVRSGYSTCYMFKQNG